MTLCERRLDVDKGLRLNHMTPRKSRPLPATLKTLRIAADLTQTEAGAIVGVPLRTWQEWEYGKRNMSPLLWHCWRHWVRGKDAPPIVSRKTVKN